MSDAPTKIADNNGNDNGDDYTPDDDIHGDAGCSFEQQHILDIQ